MTKRIKISDLPEFDAAEYLNSEEDIAAYLTTVIEENDPALLAAALGDIARARGMSQVAQGHRIRRCRRPKQKMVYVQWVMTSPCEPC